MTPKGPYIRLYRSIIDDPMFEKVFDNDKALAQWLRMLLDADAMWPVSAPVTRRNATFHLLVEVGLVLERPGNRYAMKGLDAERERRSASARIANAVRWESERSPNGLLEEKRREEKRRDSPNGQPATFLRMPDRSHHGQHPGCLVCHPAAAPTPDGASA